MTRLTNVQIEEAIKASYGLEEELAELAALCDYDDEEDDDRESGDVKDVGQNPVWCLYC